MRACVTSIVLAIALSVIAVACGSDETESASSMDASTDGGDAAIRGSDSPGRGEGGRNGRSARQDGGIRSGEADAASPKDAEPREVPAAADGPGDAPVVERPATSMTPTTDAAVGPSAGSGAAAPAADDDASVDDDAGVIACEAPNLEGLALAPVVSGQGLETLGAAVQPPDSSDWYLVEQRGRILILRDGVLLPEPFLDVQPEIVIGQGYEDRGLISLAFAPDYAASGLAYVVFTPTLGADANRDLVLEYQRSAEDPDRLEPASRRKIVEIVGSVSNNFLRNIHNGGRATFGPDGYLYVAMGDGGGVSCNDVEPDEPQDVGSPFGKILRLDPQAAAPHAAPRNPFTRGGDPRVYHYGLRNPYNFSFDRLTGDLYIGDVGQNSYEEVDFAPSGSAGLNFGWAAFEGVTPTCPDRALRAEASHTPPIFVADRRTRSCTGPYCDFRAVVGGVVYRGPSLSQLEGVYLFGDYVGRRMVGLRQCGGGSSEPRTIRKRCDVGFADELCFEALDGTPVFSSLTGIVEGNDGEIYLVANRDSLLKVVARPAP
jgi:glucose/arabinose dehydrogenase